jgi:DNA-binding GntR family transcriptional regulator
VPITASKGLRPHRISAAPSGISRSEYARAEIEMMILGGEIAMGDRLNEQSLATRLGISRGPIREAIRLLETGRLVSGRTNHGAFVRHITGDEASDIYDIRASLFGLACHSLAKSITPEQLSDLSKKIADMSVAAEKSDNVRYYRLNLSFHDAIMRFSGRRRTCEVYNSLVKELHLFRRSALTRNDRMSESNAEHACLVRALASRNAKLSRKLAEEHAQNGKRRWIESLAEGID